MRAQSDRVIFLTCQIKLGLEEIQAYFGRVCGRSLDDKAFVRVRVVILARGGGFRERSDLYVIEICASFFRIRLIIKGKENIFNIK